MAVKRESASTASSRPRASAVVLRYDTREVLMVKHRRQDGSEYWQLPGGAIEPGERPEEATQRELREETGLVGAVVRHLFTIPYKHGTSTTFLVTVDAAAQAILGADPEESGAEHRKLVDIAWRPLTGERDNPEIRALLRAVPDELS